MKVTRLDTSPLGTAYTLAQLSRSELSLSAIEGRAKENAVLGMTRIVDKYGHGSVRGMGHVPLVFENVSMLEAMRFFYLCPLCDGQEMSTRYVLMQDTEGPHRAALSIYREVYRETSKYLASLFGVEIKGRVLDCARYLLPMSLSTRFGAVQSGREWARYGSLIPDHREAIKQVFVSDDVLIRHMEGRPLPALSTHLSFEKDLSGGLIYPHLYMTRDGDHHQEPFPLPEGYCIYGYLDIGSLKDLNRHRPIKKLLPFLHGQQEMERRFSVHPYIEGSSIESLYRESYEKLVSLYPEDFFHGQLVPYVFSGTYHDWRYLLCQRIGAGGHLSYRRWSWEVSQLLSKEIGYEQIREGLEEPTLSKEEYLARP